MSTTETDNTTTNKDNDSFPGLFAFGACWIRADFHLHTEMDRQFMPIPEGISFKKAWVDRLAKEDVRLGVITNHNKFDIREYKVLRREAARKEIYILPGVELCVTGGRSGVHILIVFDPETWVFNTENEDFINRFLDNAFPHAANRESDDAPCDWTLPQTLTKLEDHRKNKRDAFVILAHVDDTKGAFKELGGGLETYFDALFEKTVLAVQKVRSRANWDKLSQWVNKKWQPAKVEGSDGKSLETVGAAHTEGNMEKRCYLKLGAFSFQAVRLALLMKEQRVSDTLPAPSSGYIRSLTFTGGLLDAQTLRLNPDMNNFIGIRGSGKSSVIECLRYLLDIGLACIDEDDEYKEKLVERTLGSGGKVSAEVVTGDNKVYQFQRILGETPRVSGNEGIVPHLRPRSLLKTRYFGQKDLVKFSEQKFARDLIDRFTAHKSTKEEEIEQVRQRAEQRLAAIVQYQKHLEKIEEIKADLAEKKESLKKFTEKNLQEKLEAQIALESDVKEADDIVTFQEDTTESLRRWYEDYETPLKRRLSQKTASDLESFGEVMAGLNRFAERFDKIRILLEEMETAHAYTRKAQAGLKEYFEAKKEEFAEIRRTVKIEGELNPDTYVELTKKKNILEAKLSELQNIRKKEDKAYQELLKDLLSLQALWNEAYQERMQEVKRLNERSDEVTVKLAFKADKAAFTERLNSLTSGIQRRTLQKVCDVFADGVELYRDLFFSNAERLTDEAGLNQAQINRLYADLAENLKSIITYCPPDRPEILYKNEPLHDHSLGQRATALMLFLLGQKDFDLLIIDQPEDDLDNQTIYTEVIKRLLDLKGQRQIIFATHSPNIPVLGDAEQICRCTFSPDTIQLLTGPLDDRIMQQEVVTVMEGGEDAFKKRQQIYESWNR